MNETGGFGCLGHSNWTICSPLGPFCSGKYQFFFTFILGGQFLLLQRTNKRKGKFPISNRQGRGHVNLTICSPNAQFGHLPLLSARMFRKCARRHRFRDFDQYILVQARERGNIKLHKDDLFRNTYWRGHTGFVIHIRATFRLGTPKPAIKICSWINSSLMHIHEVREIHVSDRSYGFIFDFLSFLLKIGSIFWKYNVAITGSRVKRHFR